MLIRSQDKSTVINDINGGAMVTAGSPRNYCNIAEYSTKEKALKVLDMIQEAYVNGHIDFQMPAEGSVEV